MSDRNPEVHSDKSQDPSPASCYALVPEQAAREAISVPGGIHVPAPTALPCIILWHLPSGTWIHFVSQLPETHLPRKLCEAPFATSLECQPLPSVSPRPVPREGEVQSWGSPLGLRVALPLGLVVLGKRRAGLSSRLDPYLAT